MEEKLELNDFNWYPGHIAKAERQLKEKIKVVDIIIELRDARIPEASSHKQLAEWAQGKTIISCLTKSDLADPARLNPYLKANDLISISPKNPSSLKHLTREIEIASKPIIEKFKAKGVIGRAPRVMIVGFPNVGKSTLINALAKKKKAKVQNKPGVTRQQQWVDVKSNFNLKLLDTPGIIPTKFDSDDQALKLALCSCVADKAFEWELAARAGLNLLKRIYPDFDPGYEITDEAKAQRFINAFRSSKLGNLSLE